MECALCGGDLVPPKRKYCSRECRLAAKAAGERDRRERRNSVSTTRAVLGPHLCDYCSGWVKPSSHGGSVKRHCSPLCRKRAEYAMNGSERERRRQRDVGAYQRSRYETDPEWRRRRLTDMSMRHHQKRTRSLPDERFGLDDIFKRDGGRCHLCGKKVDRSDASMDHIIPMSLDGEHSLANVALAHQSCNSSKGTRPRGEQLRLIG